jgi:hypothetical protein
LSEGGAKVPDARRTQVEADVEKLKARVARIDLATDVPRADVFIDDVAAGSTPLAAPLVVSAGRRKVTVAKGGYATVTRWIDVAGGDTASVSIDLVEAQAPAPAAPAPVPVAAPEKPSGAVAQQARPRGSGGGALWAGWVAAGSLAVAAGVTGTLALESSRELRDLRNQQGASREDLDRKAADVRNLALATDVVAGASIVAATITLVFTLSRGGPSSSESVSLELVPGRVGLTGKF